MANLSLIKSDFFQFWLNAFGVFFIVHLYELIVLDFLIIIKWHPSFLKLPDTEYYNTFMPHFKGFLKGIPIGVIASFIVALISMVLI